MKLQPIERLIPASYNPRKVDPERLALVELSIKKLGWLLPVYATETGELLSGHQRSHVARSIGYTEVPTVSLPAMDDRTRKAVNILFNRSTNDMDVDAVPAELKKRLEEARPFEIASELPDRSDHYPCLKASVESIEPYLKANAGKWIPYARNVAVSLSRYGVLMPIIVGPDKRVVNGIGRLQMLAERKVKTALFVHLSKTEAEFAALTLNLLSMDFAVEDKYADLLRFNSFRRARRVRRELGRGFIFSVANASNTANFDHTNPQHIARWKAKHGNSVVDFGARHLHETEILREMGVRVSPFEPFRLGVGNDIDKPGSIHLVREFLKDVAAGVRYSSVFISSVLNSVPFMSDRKHIAKICSALCDERTTLYAWATASNHSNIKNIGSKGLSQGTSGRNVFLLNYESNVLLGDFQDKPKVQKYHSTEEFYELFKSAFKRVNIKLMGDSVAATCREPVGVEGLREALEFEFDLSYPDGKRMGLVSEAIEAFEKRLKVKL
jgi:ParB-like chromosome segregation protein Spo0J